MPQSSHYIHVSLHRSPKDADMVDYVISSHWWTGKWSTKKDERKHHSRVHAEGSFVHPHPVTDVWVVLDELSAHASSQAALGALPATPGRERSGVSNTLPPEQPQLPPPPAEPTPTTASTDELPAS